MHAHCGPLGVQVGRAASRAVRLPSSSGRPQTASIPRTVAFWMQLSVKSSLSPYRPGPSPSLSSSGSWFGLLVIFLEQIEVRVGHLTLRIVLVQSSTRFIGFNPRGFNKISHENISGKRAASGGAGCYTVVLICITCPAITVVTVILRALDKVRGRALGWLGPGSPKSQPHQA